MGAEHRKDSLHSHSDASSHNGSLGPKTGDIRMKRLNGPKGIDNQNFLDDEGRVNGHVPRVSVVSSEIEVVPPEQGRDEVDAWEKMPAAQDEEDGPPWSSLTPKEKALRILLNLAKFVGLLGLLYFFICSLDLLGSAFRLMAGRAAGDIFRESELLANPVTGLMIGILVTVLLQSSSTSTSIVVAMVSSKILRVEQAIFIIMGANIGTSVTSTIVAMSQAGDRDCFRRAFAGGTVHDMFNWLTVLVLVPVEWGTHYLYYLTEAITDTMGNSSDVQVGELQFLQAATRPFTDLIVQVDEGALEHFAAGNTDGRVLKTECGLENVTLSNGTSINQIIPCTHLFMDSGLEDLHIGLIMLFLSLFIICTSLVLLVKLLSSVLKGAVAKAIKKTVNYRLPKPFGFLTGYIAILVGAGLTVIVQSSSVFTSTLTPLVGLGVIEIERMYPLVLGSNLGTTATSVLAALASSPATFHQALQTALVHLFFNLSGVLLWYSIPFMRKAPIGAAKVLGNTTAKYRWFAIMYIILMFLVVPGVVFGLSMAGFIYLGVFGGLFLLIFIVVIVINILQRKKPKWLPRWLRHWDWLPLWMHSLEPLDRVIRAIFSVCGCCRNVLNPAVQ
ncbi:sodium-dependent phosphate transport protein 2B-like [Paramacrobiotus metropolitanus]|uniref:sodium-dependent phosphate transport protein 2B-like n=1 Tax=Paramacrobiotus metropolitanus TaxID=2943436 RepID=UPI00244614A4|nr:sodium-dependent phosphate transport protein 2B-like [Paramacrobiotus metropolitanus]